MSSTDAPRRVLRPVQSWAPRPGDAPRELPAPAGERVIVRLEGALTECAVVLAAVFAVFDAGRGAAVVILLAGRAELTQAEALEVVDLLPSLVDDPRALPDVELHPDLPGLLEGAAVVIAATGSPRRDARTVMDVAGMR